MKDNDLSDQRRDEMLLRVLKTPPQPRPKRDRGNPKTTPASDASGGKRSPAA